MQAVHILIIGLLWNFMVILFHLSLTSVIFSLHYYIYLFVVFSLFLFSDFDLLFVHYDVVCLSYLYYYFHCCDHMKFFVFIWACQYYYYFHCCDHIKIFFVFIWACQYYYYCYNYIKVVKAQHKRCFVTFGNSSICGESNKMRKNHV